MCTVVDFHSHILPEIDDGSESLPQSLAMLRMEAEQGIRQVVATPHFYAHQDNLEHFIKKRERAEQCLKKSMANLQELPDVIVGAEVHYFQGISESEEISSLAIGQTNYILIEMPDSPWSNDMYLELSLLHKKRGLMPIVAHVDRYLECFRTYGIPQRLAAIPVLVQANADFFLNSRTAGRAIHLLKGGYIHLIGSDCHNMRSRKPNLGFAVNAIQKRLGEAAIERINGYEQAVLFKQTT